jgi:DNA-binding MurR/RpiR family transcriptional regulator
VEDLRADKVEMSKAEAEIAKYVLDPEREYSTPEDKNKAYKRIKDKVEMSSIRSLAIPEINEITYAETNKQKAAVLKKVKEMNSKEEFAKIVDKLIILGLITEGLLVEYNNLK